MRSEKEAQIKYSRFDRIDSSGRKTKMRFQLKEGNLILTNLKLSIHNTRNGQKIVLQTSDIHERIASKKSQFPKTEHTQQTRSDETRLKRNDLWKVSSYRCRERIQLFKAEEQKLGNRGNERCVSVLVFLPELCPKL